MPHFPPRDISPRELPYPFRLGEDESYERWLARMRRLDHEGIYPIPRALRPLLDAAALPGPDDLRSDPVSTGGRAGHLEVFHTPSLDDEPPVPQANLSEPDGPLSTLLGMLRKETEEREFDDDGHVRPEDDGDLADRRWTDTIVILKGDETIEPRDPTGRYSRGRRVQPEDRHPVFKALRHIPPQVVFVPDRTPHSLSNLYGQGRSKPRRIKVILTSATVDGVMGTVIQSGGPLPSGDTT